MPPFVKGNSFSMVWENKHESTLSVLFPWPIPRSGSFAGMSWWAIPSDGPCTARRMRIARPRPRLIANPVVFGFANPHLTCKEIDKKKPLMISDVGQTIHTFEYRELSLLSEYVEGSMERCAMCNANYLLLFRKFRVACSLERSLYKGNNDKSWFKLLIQLHPLLKQANAAWCPFADSKPHSGHTSKPWDGHNHWLIIAISHYRKIQWIALWLVFSLHYCYLYPGIEKPKWGATRC